MSELASLGRSWLGPPADAGADASAAYTELLLLNVYPYASLYRDVPAELNGPSSLWAARRFAGAGFAPPELDTVAAPDHVGLCLAYLDRAADGGFLRFCLEWIPVFTLAVEREPSADSSYGSLARETREALLSRGGMSLEPLEPALRELPTAAANTDEEVRLSDVVRYILSPALCGFFLSRSRLGRMAREIGLRLPFGARFEVAVNLFASAGEAGRVADLLESLDRERESWNADYDRLAGHHPGWAPFAALWRRRTAAARGRLAEMKELLARPLDLDYSSDAPG
ncbi:MAG: molecular chaperone TorD family protein [Thermoanaerobaculia bacterium]